MKNLILLKQLRDKLSLFFIDNKQNICYNKYIKEIDKNDRNN